MPDKIISVPGTGNVAFPDTMSDDEISAVLSGQEAPAPNAGLAPAAGAPSIPDKEPTGLQSVAAAGPSAGAMGMTSLTGLKADPMQAGLALQSVGKGTALGASMVAPAVTGGASLPLQMGVGGLSGALQSKLEGGSNKEAGVSAAIGAALPVIGKMLPKPLLDRIGKSFAEFTSKYGGQIIDHSAPAQVALEAYDAANAGATLPKVLNRFIQRMAKPGAAPMTIEEARRFASNASSKSVQESMSQNANMQRLVGRFADEMHNAIGEASGAPAEYRQLLQNYSMAKGYQATLAGIKKWAARVAVAGAGAEGAYQGYKIVRR